MIITCPSCQSRFAVKAESIGSSGRMVRCAKCKHSWFQEPPEASIITAERMADEKQQELIAATTSPSEPANFPAIINNKPDSLYIKFAFAVSCFVLFLALTVVLSNVMIPYAGFYYGLFGVHDDSGIALSDVSITKIGEGAKKELLVKGRIVNNSPVNKAIPNLRIKILSHARKTLRTVDLNSHDTALSPGEGIDFENKIENSPQDAALVVMEIGNIINLAAR